MCFQHYLDLRTVAERSTGYLKMRSTYLPMDKSSGNEKEPEGDSYLIPTSHYVGDPQRDLELKTIAKEDDRFKGPSNSELRDTKKPLLNPNANRTASSSPSDRYSQDVDSDYVDRDFVP